MTLPVDPERYLSFLAVMAALAATPGPANLFSISNGLTRGLGGVLSGVAGMTTATLIWFAGAAAGLGALAKTFPEPFRWMTFAGAAYVLWLGVQAWRTAMARAADPDAEPAPTLNTGRSAFVDGLIVQASNPKALIFFTAVLPPFLDLDRALVPQLALFALGTVTLDLITMTTYGAAGAALTRHLNRPAFRRAFYGLVGALLFASAIMILARALG